MGNMSEKCGRSGAEVLFDRLQPYHLKAKRMIVHAAGMT